LGDMPAAVERFERAYVERDGILIYLSTDPVAERVWHNPQIIALIRRMGLDIPSAR
jgi:hypothetical protein